jgi:hypothetical protein
MARDISSLGSDVYFFFNWRAVVLQPSISNVNAPPSLSRRASVADSRHLTETYL